MFTVINFTHQSFGSPRHGNQRRKEIKRIQTGKEVKLSLFVDDMTVHIGNPKDATRKLLELINEFSQVALCKINIQESFIVLYTNNKILEREIN